MISKNYIKIRSYYRSGSLTKEQIHDLVGKAEGITPAEYRKITGEEYRAR